MRSVILKTASNYLLPLLLLFSVFILLRGHYQPGGGFVGGLITSVAFVLHAFANGLEKTRAFLKYHPGVVIPIGLAISLLSGLAPMLSEKPFMTGIWFKDPLPVDRRFVQCRRLYVAAQKPCKAYHWFNITWQWGQPAYFFTWKFSKRKAASNRGYGKSIN
jgi:multicomponent Na+:H+ antiporter subunit B